MSEGNVAIWAFSTQNGVKIQAPIIQMANYHSVLQTHTSHSQTLFTNLPRTVIKR